MSSRGDDAPATGSGALASPGHDPSSRLGLHANRQGTESAGERHADGVLGLSKPLADLTEAQLLQLAKEDDFLVIVVQSLQRFFEKRHVPLQLDAADFGANVSGELPCTVEVFERDVLASVALVPVMKVDTVADLVVSNGAQPGRE